MFVARMICSDMECAEAITVHARTLAEFDAMACACGCTFEVIGFPDWVDDPPGGVVVRLVRRPRSGGDGLSEAA